MKYAIAKSIAIISFAILLSGWSLWGSSVPDCDGDGIANTLSDLIIDAEGWLGHVKTVKSKLHHVRQAKYDDENKIRYCEGIIDSTWGDSESDSSVKDRNQPPIHVQYDVYQTTDGDIVRLRNYKAQK